MEKKYSNKKLEWLAKDDLIWVKKSEYYQKLLDKSMDANGYTTEQPEEDRCSDIIHEELWWDVCDIVHDLAQMVLDEREKRAKFLNELKRELKDTMSNLSSKRFDEYY